jgi:hypothetical protein
MIGHLQNPPAEFSEIIKAHYYMKKDKLIKVGTGMKLKDILGINYVDYLQLLILCHDTMRSCRNVLQNGFSNFPE